MSILSFKLRVFNTITSISTIIKWVIKGIKSFFKYLLELITFDFLILELFYWLFRIVLKLIKI